ncbi:M23 family metallopeptidase [uncultured Chryseobacterium sp.]|uniref:M23 family metallopeptidase n=1 Tax=uncultured Chryseobacterium sp. TaxID=259322 RepID=UPI00262CC37A|nr:M23 family metallopeptidase [uncultured Chryseobacterium sp.]
MATYTVNFFKYFIFFLLVLGCTAKSRVTGSLHNKKQATIYLDYQISKDKITFDIRNSLYSPVRISLKTKDSILQQRFGTLTLQPLKDTVYVIGNTDLDQKNLNFKVELGDVQKNIVKKKLGLPFAKGKSYEILQSHNGSFSHNQEDSRFAIDFAMKVGDTVFTADEGYIVGVIDFHDQYGNESFKDYANFVTVYNDKTGVYIQYVHLKKDKVFVKVGEKVRKNQPIALVGLSGFMDGEHLHFNTLVPSESGLKSIPSDFDEYNGEEIYKGKVVSHELNTTK